MGAAVPTNLSEQTTWCSYSTIVPTMIVGTPNGGFLLAVHTNLSEQTTIYNSATGRIKIAAAVGF